MAGVRARAEFAARERCGGRAANGDGDGGGGSGLLVVRAEVVDAPSTLVGTMGWMSSLPAVASAKSFVFDGE
jgi:hypothetical protein